MNGKTKIVLKLQEVIRGGAAFLTLGRPKGGTDNFDEFLLHFWAI